MEQFQLIIQKTTTGLNIEYSSPGIDPGHPNVIKTLEDERAFATQIVKDSDVYTLEITEHFRIYSLIVTDIDKFGRSGFYEFKLYGPREKPLENFYVILQEIKAKYNEDTSNKPYESILSKIALTPDNGLVNFIKVKRNNKKYYSFYEENNLDSLEDSFKEKGVFLISKLYALNRSKAYDENVIQSVGLLPFTKGLFKEVTISNPHHKLKDLFLNNEKLQINNIGDEFKLLIAPNDVLTYTKLDSNTTRPISRSFHTIEREPVIHKPQSLTNHKAKKKSFFRENGIYLLALVIIATGAYIGFPQYSHFLGVESKDLIQDENISNPIVQQEVVVDTSLITFQKIKEGNTLKFQTSFKGLDKYVFSLSNDKWSFINYEGQKTTGDFNSGIVMDLKIDNDSILSPEEQERFIEGLENESGQSLDSVKADNTIKTEKRKSETSTDRMQTEKKKSALKSDQPKKPKSQTKEIDVVSGLNTDEDN